MPIDLEAVVLVPRCDALLRYGSVAEIYQTKLPHDPKRVSRLPVGYDTGVSKVASGSAMVVPDASSDDPFVTLERAAAFAEAWGSRFVLIGAAGHINSASSLGPWGYRQEARR